MPQVASSFGLCVSLMWMFFGELPLGSSLNLRADPCQANVSPIPTAPPPPAPPLVPPAPQPGKHMYPLPHLNSGLLPKLGPLPTQIPMPPKPTGAPPNLADLVRHPAATGVKPTDPPAGTVFVPGKVAGHWAVPAPNHTLNLPQGAVATKLLLKVLAGATMLPVVTQAGLSIGMTVDIDVGTAVHEVNRVTGFGSILLATPLQFAHETGATVIVRDGSTAPAEAPAAPSAEASAPSPAKPSLARTSRLGQYDDSLAASSQVSLPPAATAPRVQQQPNSQPNLSPAPAFQWQPIATTTTFNQVHQVKQANNRIREMAGLKPRAAAAANLTSQTPVADVTPTKNQTQLAGLPAANQTQPDLPPGFVLSKSAPTNQPANAPPPVGLLPAH